MKVTLTADDGREYDITEHFKVMYDNVVGSMDWGSGFLDGGEALTVMQAGAAAGFDVYVSENLVNSFTANVGIGPDYYALRRGRREWIDANIGNPITWDSIAAYRQKLQEEMENVDD